MFIVFEGVDASGKTTTARKLSEEIEGGVYYATPPKQFLERREEVDLSSSVDDHYKFYAEGIQIASGEIWSLLSEGKTVVVDRYWMSTYVYHVVMGAQVADEDFVNIIRPDLTILLTVDSEEQARRFLQRGMTAGDKRMLHQQPTLAEVFQKTLVDISCRHSIINTTRKTPAEVVSHTIMEMARL